MGWGSCSLGREVQPVGAVKRVATRPVGRGLWPWAAPLLLVAASCASYPPLKGRFPEEPAISGRESVPSWQRMRHGNPGLVPALRDWIRRQPRSNSATYWQVEAHLRLAEEMRTEPDLRQECLAEYRWVLKHTTPRESQQARANAGLARLTRDSGFHYPGTIRRDAWGALTELPREMDPASSMWKWITVHHSAMPVSTKVHENQTVGHQAVRAVQASHMSSRGYGDVGYHFLVDPAGRVYEGRSLKWQGAHAKGKNNVGNIGICLLGNFENGPPTRQAQAALHGLVGSLRSGFAIGATRVVGHSHWTSTKCPGRHLTAVLRRYR